MSLPTRELASNDDKEKKSIYISNYDTRYGTIFFVNFFDYPIFSKYLLLTRSEEQAIGGWLVHSRIDG